MWAVRAPVILLDSGIGIIGGRDVEGDRDSDAPKPRRLCPQKEILASAIQRDRRKIPRWLSSGWANSFADRTQQNRNEIGRRWGGYGPESPRKRNRRRLIANSLNQ